MLLLPLILTMQTATLQAGGNPSPQAPSELPIPRAKKAQAAPPPPAAPVAALQQDRFALCMAKVRSDPAAAAKDAESWIAENAKPEEQKRPMLCLGMAQSALLAWEAAEQTFTALAQQTPVATGGEEAVAFRAMGATAALAGGFPERAMILLDQAVAGGSTVPAEELGGIQIDRGRALVALERLDEARKAFDAGLALVPNDSDGWLLSATLYRRVRDLPKAQADIEKAATLAPTDPAVGLEAGVIAMLDGREASARKSWNSVIALAPQSNEARIAQGYLDQIGPEQPAAAAP